MSIHYPRFIARISFCLAIIVLEFGVLANRPSPMMTATATVMILGAIALLILELISPSQKRSK